MRVATSAAATPKLVPASATPAPITCSTPTSFAQPSKDKTRKAMAAAKKVEEKAVAAAKKAEEAAQLAALLASWVLVDHDQTAIMCA